MPQSAVSPPQPSATRPQFAPASAQVRGTQVVWQAPFEQAWFEEQAPQSGVSPPQPSATWPHIAPRFAQLRGVQAGPPH